MVAQEASDGALQLFGPARKRTRRQPPQQEAVPAAAASPEREVQAQPLSQAAEPDGDRQGFRALGLSQWLESTCTSLGITAPTAVQRSCIPHILQARLLSCLAAWSHGPC